MTYKDPAAEAAAKARWYQENKARHMANVKKNTQAMFEWARALKDMKPCTDCGVAYPYYVMDWDHLEDKSFNLSKMINQFGKPRILAEIAKCELVCANCHRVRSWTRTARYAGVEPADRSFRSS